MRPVELTEHAGSDLSEYDSTAAHIPMAVERATGLHPNGILILAVIWIGYICSATIPTRRDGNWALQERGKPVPESNASSERSLVACTSSE